MKKFLVAYFFSVFFFLTFFCSGFIDSLDGMQYLAIARRIYFDQTLQMPQERFPDENVHMSYNINQKGERYSPTGLGYTLALLPAVFLEDVLTRQAGVQPVSAFPLQNDWPVWFFASFINAFFGALFVITLYSYLRTFDVDHWPSVIYSLLGLVATNIFPYTKHTFAHMMFVSFMTLSFYYLRRFGQTKKRVFIALAAASYGIVVISYNPSFLLLIPGIGMYYLLQNEVPGSLQFSSWLVWFKKFLLDLVVALISFAPFGMMYWWFNLSRFQGGLQTGYGSNGIPLPSFPEAYVFVEGFWGLLFSPGKSIFLFTPVLILLLTHWFKISGRWKKELIAGLTIFFVFFYFIGTLVGGPDFLVWHGESSWGPRYMLPTIPLLYLVVVGIVTRMSRLSKLFIFAPLVLLGIIVQLTGMLLPYQIRFAGLDINAHFSGRNNTVYEYANHIPRYSPVFNQFKTLVKRLIRFPKQMNHGKNNLVLKDGFGRPFDFWGNAWREPYEKATITFESSEKNPVNSLEFRFRNHQMQPSGTASAQLSFTINGQELADKLLVKNDFEEIIHFDLDPSFIKEENTLMIYKDFIGPGQTRKTQLVFLQSIHINGQPYWLGTVDFPYVSPVSQELLGINYDYFGGEQKKPWLIWEMRSGIYEETLDLWWLRPLHVWDLPKGWFAAGFGLTVVGWVLSSWLMVRFTKQL